MADMSFVKTLIYYFSKQCGTSMLKGLNVVFEQYFSYPCIRHCIHD